MTSRSGRRRGGRGQRPGLRAGAGGEAVEAASAEPGGRDLGSGAGARAHPRTPGPGVHSAESRPPTTSRACRRRLRTLSEKSLGPDARAPPESQGDQWGPDQRPVAPGPRADLLGALRPFLFSGAPTCPPNRRGQGGGIGRSWVSRPPSAPPPGRLAPPSTPAPAPGETLLSCPAPGLPASPAPGPERCSVQNRNPSPSRHPPPFRRTSTCPMFYLATRGVFSTGAGEAEGRGRRSAGIARRRGGGSGISQRISL